MNKDQVCKGIPDSLNRFSEFDEILEQEYLDMFYENFKGLHDLYSRFKSKVTPITDEELSYIMTTLPLQLFDVSENLNYLKLRCEILKIDMKTKSADVRLNSSYDADSGLTKGEYHEYLNNVIASTTEEDQIVLALYRTLIERVESERMYAKELIMGAKKIWDSRRSAEESAPVQPTDLPEYDSMVSQYELD